MGVKRIALRAANSMLGRYNLCIASVVHDFDSRLDSPAHLEQLFDELAQPIEAWLQTQRLFSASEISLRSLIEEFYAIYLASPFRRQGGGSRFNNLLWLYLLSYVVRPKLIIDSGTYTGASAWALSLASPNATVYSFDIDMSRLVARCPGVEYIETDWTNFEFSGQDVSRGLCYFDDHLDQIGRLLQAQERGFPLAIFDDDFPLTSFVSMAHEGRALPKLEFALNNHLTDKDVIRWTSQGQSFEWQIDLNYLNKGRAAIRATERLPDISHITGIYQTPYRVVALNPCTPGCRRENQDRPLSLA